MAASRVLVYGGKGALGASIVNFFKGKSWWVLSVDLFQNDLADANVIISGTSDWVEQGKEVATKVEEVLKNDKLDAIVCVAGGWAGGNAASNSLVKNCDLMCKQSIWSSVLASQIAAHHLNSGGLLVLTGAKAALEGTPGMIGYGMAKAAVHQLVQSLKDSSSGLPPDAGVIGVLPVTLDTEANRRNMPNADFSQWTPLEFVAETVLSWVDKQNRPASGSLLSLVTSDGVTTVSQVNQ